MGMNITHITPMATPSPVRKWSGTQAAVSMSAHSHCARLKRLVISSTRASPLAL